jgi:hypothetical protein
MLLKKCRPPARFDFLENIELWLKREPVCKRFQQMQVDSHLKPGKGVERVFEQISSEQIIDRVMHIYALYRDTADPTTRRSPEHSIRLRFLRGIIDNLKHRRSRLSPRMLGQLSYHAGLTIGGAFRLVGYPLDKLRAVEFLLNGHRTRIVESHPFHRDRKIDLPRTLSERATLDRTVFLSEVIRDWQSQVSIRSLEGDDWGRRKAFYVQIGGEDGIAMSGLPPGAVLSIELVSEIEQLNPDPNAIYCLRFRNGYRCSACAVSKGRLILLLYDNRYEGPYTFFYPQEVRIVGRARGFAVALTPPSIAEFPDMLQACGSTPLILPWAQGTLADLWRTQRVCFGLRGRSLERANDVLSSCLGFSLGSRTLRRYQHAGSGTPHSDALIGLTLFHITRLSDVFRLLGFWNDESSRYSLSSWLDARSLADLDGSRRMAETPVPHSRWRALLDGWGEWPPLISMAFPNLEGFQHRLILIHQSDIFDGLAPSIKPGAIALLEEDSEFPSRLSDRNASEWGRPIYAIRYKERILCGHLDCNSEHVTLIPHIRSRARRISFLRHHISMVGKWIGVASPLL